jgi:hypothetical protein
MRLMANRASFFYKVVTFSGTMVFKLEHVSESPRGLLTKQMEDSSLEFLILVGLGISPKNLHF